MRIFRTLRNKLTIIYLMSIVIPFIVMALALPYSTQVLITRETRQLTEGTLHAVSQNIEMYLDDLERLTASPYLNDNVIDALKIKAKNNYDSASAYTKLQTDRALTGTLPNYLINTREDILSTIIITKNGSAYLTSKNNLISLQPDYPFAIQDWYQQAVERNGKVAFIPSHPQDYLSNQRIPQVFSVARLIKDPDSGQPLAVILADADTHILEKITQDITFNVSSIIAVVDDHGNLLYSNKRLPEQIGQQNSDFVAVSEDIQPAGWQITVYLSKQELEAKVRWIYMTAVLLSIGGLIVTFFVFHYFSHWIIKPIRQMNEVMMKVRKGNLKTFFVPAGQDELSQLGESLNRMIYQLDDLINREFKAALAQRNAEYRALQSQIQPHFLYNTLTGFVGLNRAGEAGKLETAILSLSGMLRYILQENQWTTIQEEFQFLSKYGTLQQIRFQDRLKISIAHEESIADFKIPKLLIQPILENAIIHGVEPDDKDNLVTVAAEDHVMDGQASVVITVSDNGVGFPSDIEPPDSHIGIRNVQARLQLAYPEAAIEVRSRPEAGTCVTITIPKGGASL